MRATVEECVELMRGDTATILAAYMHRTEGDDWFVGYASMTAVRHPETGEVRFTPWSPIEERS